MNKKEYIQPCTKVISLPATGVLTSSDFENKGAANPSGARAKESSTDWDDTTE